MEELWISQFTQVKSRPSVESLPRYDIANARLHKDTSQTEVWQNAGLRTEGKAEFSQAALEALGGCWMNPHIFLPDWACIFGNGQVLCLGSAI